MYRGKFKGVLCIVVLLNLALSGCGSKVSPVNSSQKNIAKSDQMKTQSDIEKTASSNEHQDSQKQEKSKVYLSTMRPAVSEEEVGKEIASDQQMKELLVDAETYFNSKPLADIMTKSGNGMTEESASLKPGSDMIMLYRTSKPSAVGEVPIIAVGFGLGVNSIDAHELLWYENGKWKSQPYPQADAETAKKRMDVLGKGPFLFGQFWELHQKGNLLVVLNNFYGTHLAEEVQLLQRDNDVWKVLWVPTYEQWQELYDSRIEFHDGINSFTAYRQDIKNPDHKWQEVWNLQGNRYVMASSTTR